VSREVGSSVAKAIPQILESGFPRSDRAERLECGELAPAFGSCAPDRPSLRTSREHPSARLRTPVIVLAFVLFGGMPISGNTNSVPTADTNSSASDEIPKLRPPRPEIPPTAWEQHHTGIICGVSLLVALGVLGAWYLTRPKPPVLAPAIVQARAALEALRSQPENGLALSKVSQVVRYYFTAALNLPPAELNTTEFCRAIAGVKMIGPDLAADVSDFLRQCDQRKFAALPAQPPLGAVALATKFINQTETCLAALAQSSANSDPRSPVVPFPHDR